MSDYGNRMKEMHKIYDSLGFEPKSFWNFTLKGDNIKDEIAKVSLREDIENNWMKVGKKSYSKFNTNYSKRLIKYFTNTGDIILDPFAGRTRAIVCKNMKRKYYGFEIGKESFEQISKSDLNDSVKIFNDDSFNIDKYDIPYVDMIFTCPPYWNREVYENVDGELSHKSSYQSFLNKLFMIFEKSLTYLKQGGFFVVVVSDFSKDKELYPFHSDIINYFKGKLKYYTFVILEMSPAKRHPLYFQAILHRKFLTTSEFALVFRKGSSNDINRRNKVLNESFDFNNEGVFKYETNS
tara:strand:- start:428 stop:1309 length:882 start_codon:yes stop_codon:yes gene_type:complete